jgi:hypothetical protein
MFLRIVGPPVKGTTRGKFLKSIHPRSSAGEFKAARSLQWRRATGAVRGLRRGSSPQHEVSKKQKGPDPFRNPGLWQESLKVCAYALPPPGCG